MAPMGHLTSHVYRLDEHRRVRPNSRLRSTTVTTRARNFSWPGFFLGLVAAALAVLTVIIGVHTPSNTLATSLLQAATFIIGVLAAYIFAKASAAAAAIDLVRPYARSAFRRQRRLYEGLGRLIDEIDLQMSSDDANSHPGLRILRAMIIEQVGTSGDALDDWRDLVPDEVAQLERREQGITAPEQAP
jgi:hypothetical protein